VIKKWYTAAQANCNGTWCWVTNTTTLPAGINTWWVQTWNSTGYGPWSNGLTFTVGASGSQAVETGMILAGKQVCGLACAELALPYVQDTWTTLQVMPEAGSYFVHRETADGFPLAGTHYEISEK
jgi:hypothetical protein